MIFNNSAIKSSEKVQRVRLEYISHGTIDSIFLFLWTELAFYASQNFSLSIRVSQSLLHFILPKFIHLSFAFCLITKNILIILFDFPFSRYFLIFIVWSKYQMCGQATSWSDHDAASRLHYFRSLSRLHYFSLLSRFLHGGYTKKKI